MDAAEVGAPPRDVLVRTAAALRRTLGPAGEGLAATLDAVASGDLDPDTGLARLGQVLERAGDGATSFLLALDADLELLRWLVDHDDPRVTRAAVLTASQCGLTSWFARDPSPAVRRAVAAHAPQQGRLLDLLAADPAPSVRLVVASRDALPESVATTLVTDPSWQVRFALAGRPGLPGVVVRRLAQDEDRRVRARIAARPAPIADARARAIASVEAAATPDG